MVFLQVLSLVLLTIVEITAQHLPSKSQVCANVFCGAGRECAINENGHPICLCIEECRGKPRVVCGDNGRTYMSSCDLHRDACLMGSTIHIAHSGACIEKQTEEEAEQSDSQPVACLQADREALRQVLIQQLEKHVEPRGWLGGGLDFRQVLEKQFQDVDGGDGMLDSSELLDLLKEPLRTAHPPSSRQDIIRSLCADALLEMADKDRDWKLSLEELHKGLDRHLSPPHKKCSLGDEQFEDGALQRAAASDCNMCMCAAGNWVCTKRMCRVGDKEMDKDSQQLTFKEQNAVKKKEESLKI
uniref:follistatin-related protein 1-like n=2 Tax=Myxine glutinosa TaxID=7769 RepID=UPI00358FB6CA